jgi:hypothetical protein
MSFLAQQQGNLPNGEVNKVNSYNTRRRSNEGKIAAEHKQELGLSPSKDWDLIKSGFWAKTNYAKSYLDEPTYIGFKILFSFNSPDSPLFNTDENSEASAYNYYLNVLNDKERADLLLSFKDHIQFINQKTPWYFQSIDGLNDLFKTDTAKPTSGGVFKLTMLEGLDMRSFAISAMYQKLVWSQSQRRWILPVNLRRFKMWIFINEIRDIQLAADEIQKLIGERKLTAEEEQNLYADAIQKYSSSLIIEFDGCEILLNEEWGSQFSTVSNDGQHEHINHQFSISYKKFNISTYFPFVGELNTNSDKRVESFIAERRATTLPSIFQNSFINLTSPFKNKAAFIKNQINELPQRAASSGIGFVENLIKTNLINPVLLGNVYAANPSRLNRALSLQTFF